MNLALWIVAIVLAVTFAGSGVMKPAVPKDKLVTSGQGWAQDVSPTNIRLIGLVEVLGAAGLILPAVTHIAPILIPLAAIGLVFVMVGAAVVHAGRNEPVNIAVNVALLALAAFVTWGGAAHIHSWGPKRRVGTPSKPPRQIGASWLVGRE